MFEPSDALCYAKDASYNVVLVGSTSYTAKKYKILYLINAMKKKGKAVVVALPSIKKIRSNPRS
jgi:hypothetical protein